MRPLNTYGASDAAQPLYVGLARFTDAAGIDADGAFVRTIDLSVYGLLGLGFQPEAHIGGARYAPTGKIQEAVVLGLNEAMQRVSLRRESGSLSLRVQGADGCDLYPQRYVETSYAGALDRLDTVVIGYDYRWTTLLASQATAAVDNLLLRSLPCGTGGTTCTDASTGATGCTDLATSNEACGACSSPVDTWEACIGGSDVDCRLAEWAAPCPLLRSDPQNCGGGTVVGKVCTSLEDCREGMCVARLVSVTGGYSIDATEVTRDQYAAWLATGPSTSGQPTYCSWNTDFKPSSSCISDPRMCNGAGCANHPQVCVDWCDAYAYCKAVGKRLCGRIGGGSNGYSDYANASVSQWYKACSSGGAHAYPYGGTVAGGASGYQPTTCNGYDNGKKTTVSVGTCSGCVSLESGYGGVFDLSGNASEWEDSCINYAESSDLCRLRGGSFYVVENLRCDSDTYVNRNRAYAYVGFRCCAP
jgi:formylglycine-generating enzyme required for sulfatase activity